MTPHPDLDPPKVEKEDPDFPVKEVTHDGKTFRVRLVVGEGLTQVVTTEVDETKEQS